MQASITNRMVHLFPLLNVIQVPIQELMQIVALNYCTFSVRCLEFQKAEFRLTTGEMRLELKWVISQGYQHSPSKVVDLIVKIISKSVPQTPWVPEVFLTCDGNFRCWPQAEAGRKNHEEEKKPDLRLGNVFQLPSRCISRRWTRSGTNHVIFLEALCEQTNLFWRELKINNSGALGRAKRAPSEHHG